MKIFPDLVLEKALRDQGFLLVAGIDEAGRGALAGPVAAAAVVLPNLADLPEKLKQVRDSKLMTADERERSFDQIVSVAICFGIGMADHQEVDKLGILPATRKAMIRALDSLSPQPDFLLLDFVRLAARNLPQRAIPKGDQRSLSIAAASVLAKVSRDRWMRDAASGEYPGYGFERNKGYGTAEHLAALERMGPCEIHRKTFRPIRKDMTLF